MNYPRDYKSTSVFGALVKDGDNYKYDETVTHYCTAEAIAEYKKLQQNVIAAEQARDSQLVIKTAQDKIDWMDVAIQEK
jgi:hypothetical protein